MESNMESQSKIKILIVDDSSFMRVVLERMLNEQPRFEVVATAANGTEAIEKVIRLRPNVVTMDIEMPIMDGLHALKEIMRRAPTPVIMVSSLTQEGAQVTLDALDLGAVDYIGKPGSTLSLNVFTLKNELVSKILAAASGLPILHKPRMVTSVQKRPVQTGDQQTQIDRMVLIGASTGGPPAIRILLAGLSATIPAPIILAQHMPSMFTNAFAVRMNGCCPIRVKEATDGEMVQRSVVYICPGDSQTRLKSAGGGKYVFRITPNLSEGLKFAPCIDETFLSGVEHFGRKCLGIILTGMGEDGVKGLGKIRDAGGLTIAQERSSCVVYGMPRAAVEKNAATRVLSLNDMASEIELFLR